MSHQRVLTILSVSGLLLFGFGCAPSIPGVRVGTDGVTTTYTDPSTGTTVTVGAGAVIPADFPADVPVYGNGTVQSAATSTNTGTPGASLMFLTTDGAQTVGAWYEGELTGKGWKKTGTYNFGSQTNAIYTKGTTTISVTVTGDVENGQNSVLVIWADNADEVSE